MTDRDVMRQALEVLESLQGGCTDHDDGTVEAITVWCPEVIDALRAQLEQPEQEPYDQTALELCEVCCWKTLIPGDGCLNCERKAQPEQEPVAWGNGDELDNLLADRSATVSGIQSGWRRTPLYTHPPQRKPLTDEQIEELDDQVRQVTIDKGSPVGWFAMQLARAIERAHGIGEKP